MNVYVDIVLFSSGCVSKFQLLGEVQELAA